MEYIYNISFIYIILQILTLNSYNSPYNYMVIQDMNLESVYNFPKLVSQKIFVLPTGW